MDGVVVGLIDVFDRNVVRGWLGLNQPEALLAYDDLVVDEDRGSADAYEGALQEMVTLSVAVVVRIASIAEQGEQRCDEGLAYIDLLSSDKLHLAEAPQLCGDLLGIHCALSHPGKPTPQSR